MQIMMAFLSNGNLFIKNTIDLIKLSTCMFQGGMKNNGSKTCEIGKLDGSFVITRSTLFLKKT
jgi:hypothetical protein